MKRTARKKVKQDSNMLFVRNLPEEVKVRIRSYAQNKRTTTAGVIIELVEFAAASGFFNASSYRS